MNLIGRTLTSLMPEGRFAHLSGSPAVDDEFWYKPVGARGTSTGIYVSAGNSLQSSTVYACVSRIAATFASLPFNVHRRLPNDGKELARDHRLFSILHSDPNDEQTAFEFWEIAITHLLTWGNAYARIVMDDKRNVLELKQLAPHQVTPKRDPATGLRFYECWINRNLEILFDDEMFHIPWFGGDGLKGCSPIELQRRAIEHEMAASEYGARFFLNSGPYRYLAAPGPLSPTAMTNLLDWVMKKFGGLKNAHTMGILDQGITIETVATNHRDLQFLELRGAGVEEIARIYNMPLHMIQSMTAATNNNIEHQGIDYGTHTIHPICERVEQRVHKALFGVREKLTFFAEVNLDALMRGDAVSRAEYIGKRITSGTMTPNEARIRENDNPLPGGDKLYIQGAMVPLEDAGKQLTAAAPQN